MDDELLKSAQDRLAEYKRAQREDWKSYAIPGLDVPWWHKLPPTKAWSMEGIVCAIAPGGMPGFNGYVYLPEGHQWREKLPEYDDIPASVNGGLTFAHMTGWIGFDTAHYLDKWEWDELMQYRDQIDEVTLDRWERTKQIMNSYVEPVTWTVEMLLQETEDLAQQVLNA